MNDFTKEELENLSDELEGTMHYVLRQKIQSMIDNYCEHEGDGLEYMSYPPQQKCNKCGKYFR